VRSFLLIGKQSSAVCILESVGPRDIPYCLIMLCTWDLVAIYIFFAHCY
jgi:hypothetical protein